MIETKTHKTRGNEMKIDVHNHVTDKKQTIDVELTGLKFDYSEDSNQYAHGVEFISDTNLGVIVKLDDDFYSQLYPNETLKGYNKKSAFKKYLCK